MREDVDIYSSGDERDLLLPIIDESGGAECLVCDDDHRVALERQGSEDGPAGG